MLRMVILAVVLAVFGIVASTRALSQDVPKKGGVCSASLGAKMMLDPSVQFTCEHIGKRTISQIYEHGYRVVTVEFNPQNSGFVSMVIEEHK